MAYFVVTFPPLVFIGLLGYIVTLDGALDGIKFFVTEVWNVSTFSYRDAIIISTGEAVLGILATLLVSAAAGFMAREDNTTIAFQLSSEPLKFCLVQWELLWVKPF